MPDGRPDTDALPPLGAASGIDAAERTPWATDDPAPESYSRVTDPERYAILHAFADAIVADLEARYDVRPEPVPRLTGGAADHVEVLDAVRLAPSGDAAPVTIARTAFPGLLVRFGEFTDVPYPVCGCDACDEQLGDLADDLRFRLDALISGRFREARDAEGDHCEFVTDTGRSGSWSVAHGDSPRRIASRHEWTAWRART